MDPSRLPDAEDVTAAILEAERKEEERQAWLASPDAVREREQSRFAYANIDATAARELLSTVFAEQLAQLNADPARVLSDAHLLSIGGDETSATVKDEGDGLLLESSLPVRAEDEEGDLRKVDLSLEKAASGFETANALVEVQVPRSAEQSVEVGEEGVAIKLAGANEGRALQPFGGENVLASEVLPDTDMLISPIATGVEIFNVLRSEHSPETLRFQVEMPAGAELRAGGDWGAQMVRDGEVLTVIPDPVAIDAQGTDVPVELGVEGNSLLLTVKHREGDYAMPILLDPSILEDSSNWMYGQHHDTIGNWENVRNDSRIIHSTYCIYECFGPGGSTTRGLYISSEPSWYGPGSFAHWAYGAPNIHSYVKSVTLGAPYVHEDHGCPEQQYPKPHNYFGVWSANLNNWVYLSVNSANQPGGTYTLPFSGDAVIFGLSTGGATFGIGCWRDLYAGGAHIWLDDWNPPQVSASVSGVPPGWFGGAKQITVGANTSDEGLGVLRVTLATEGKGVIGQDNVGCTGERRNRCPTTRSSQFNATGLSFAEGVRTSSVSVEDPTGKTATGGNFQTKVDYSPPEVILNGQLAEATEDDEGASKGDEKTENLRLPVYNLEIEAKDGSNQSNLTRSSGVKNIEIYLDGAKQSVSWSAQSATEDSRPMKQTYQLKLSTVATAGLHKLEVKVRDQVENVRERTLEFEYFPATGMKDEYVMHYFPLPDGSGNESEEEHPDRPELAVNVMNGNLVYRETDIEVDGAAALDLDVERYYNSQLPTADNTEWGDGWTLAETPDLDPLKTGGSPIPNMAEVLDSSGAIEGDVALPTEAGGKKFDPALQATLTKKSTGGYELTDETGESATSVAFDDTGQTEALLSDGAAKVDYTYEGGELSGIEVEDPATFAADPSELEIPEPELITKPTYEKAFGTAGAGNAQFAHPGDVAIDSKGNLWVTDMNNNRIQKFNAAGQFLMQFGSYGTANGQFKRPAGIAVAANGNVFVADANNNRIQKFSEAGTYLAKIGSYGSGNGQFKGPEGVEVDNKGNVYVADTANGRIEVLNESLGFVKFIASQGSAPGQLGEPSRVDIGPGGKIWVTDWQNHKVVTFSEAGAYLSQFGSNGSGNGQFKHADGLEVDGLGNVWVSDEFNHRVQRFNEAGEYLGQFGLKGTANGQFQFSSPVGIAYDSKGGLWITDADNNRMQRWLVPLEKPAYVSSFGSNGSGDGQLKSPGDVAVGAEGNLFVADKSNNRIQKFDPTGKFLAKFGSLGSGDGQLNRPTAIAVDRDGNLLVADANNNRIQKFSPGGEFISKFGSAGAGNGQFSSPEGIATDLNGNIWVADSGNGRLQQFDEEGKFVKIVGSKGSGSGQLGRPTGIDVDPSSGNVWVADWQNNRVSIFSAAGGFLSQFGTFGSGPGQFAYPGSVEVDAYGNVWVGDALNGRVQRFDLAAKYVGQFGSPGTGPGQFSFPTSPPTLGIAADNLGHVWVTDVNSHRIQRWEFGNFVTPQATPLDLRDGDPSVEVETAGGLVESVSGNAAGEHVYTHSGDDLTAHDGPAGETKYKYDSAGRMTEVILPNGTWGSIVYFSDGRVKSVTVKLAEETSSKTTIFEYQDAPQRRTIVDPPDAPVVTYEIGADGSVLKWWNSAKPPTIDFIAGTLWDHKEQEDGLWAGDQPLDVQAFSAEGIASIDIVVNGNELVHETTCKQNPEVLGTECVNPPLKSEWVMGTEQYPPGHLSIEVIVTDHAEGTISKRFWVDVPEPPPPPAPGTPIPPKFAEILRFREDYGLEKVFPVANEIERNERIFNLIKAWYEGDPVARASRDRWGVPLRPADVAELEYREWLYDVNGEKIDQWVEATSPGSYAGYYMDHAAGGIMRIGFTSNQSEQLANLTTSLSLVGGGSRLSVYPTTPTASYLSVRATAQSVLGAIESNPTLASLVVSVEDDEAGKATRVGTANVAQVESILDQMLGANAPVTAEYEAGGGALLEGRYRNQGRMRAGDYINGIAYTPGGIAAGDSRCTAGFGAKDQGVKPNGEEVVRMFLLTAGHCYTKLDTEVWRAPQDESQDFDDAGKSEVGTLARDALQYAELGNVRTDGEAIRIHQGGIVPKAIWGWEGHALATEPPSRARKGNTVCYSGAISKTVACGPIVARSLNWTDTEEPFDLAGYWVRFPEDKRPQHGDSGSPVWSLRTGASIGLVSAGRPHDSLSETLVAPLLHPPNMPSNRVPGILHHMGMEPLQLVLGG